MLGQVRLYWSKLCCRGKNRKVSILRFRKGKKKKKKGTICPSPPTRNALAANGNGLRKVANLLPGLHLLEPLVRPLGQLLRDSLVRDVAPLRVKVLAFVAVRALFAVRAHGRQVAAGVRGRGRGRLLSGVFGTGQVDWGGQRVAERGVLPEKRGQGRAVSAQGVIRRHKSGKIHKKKKRVETFNKQT